MRLVEPARRYSSIEEFYAEVPDADRRLSAELEFGVHWTEPHENGWTFPRSRLTWVENTGELIVVREPRFSALHPAPVKVIAVIEGRETIEHVLDGWAHECRTEGLGWVYMRLRQIEREELGVVNEEACS